MSSEHFIKLCKHCTRVISQCRCPSENKKIIWDICDNCKNLSEPIINNLRANEMTEQTKMPDFSIAQCCGSCKYHQFSWGYEESYCDLYNADVSFALICHDYKPKNKLRIETANLGILINWD